VLLEDFGITPLEAWKYIMGLQKQFNIRDDYQDYRETKDTYVFKREINGTEAYIKVQISRESSGEMVICISFHKNIER